MLIIHWLPSGGSIRRSARGKITWRIVSVRESPSASPASLNPLWIESTAPRVISAI